MKTVKTRKGTTIQHNVRGYRYRAFKHKKQVYFPLGNDRTEAMKLADEIRDYLVTHSIEETRTKFHPDRKTVPQGDPCLYGAWKHFIYTDYKDKLGLTYRSVRTYAHCLGRILKHVGVKDRENFNLLDFQPQWVESFKTASVRGARDAEDVERKKRTFNGTLLCLKAIHAPEGKEAHESRGWHLHWGDAVRAIRPYRRCKKIYVLPSEEKIKDIHDYIETLTGDVFVACMFGLHAGLRRKEIANVSRDWIQRIGNENRLWVVPKGNFRQKGSGGFTVISDKALELIEERADTTEGRFLARNSGRTFASVLNHLRNVCDTSSPLHDLRRFFGTYIANRYDLWRAQQYLRHGKPQTTWDAYANTLISEEAMGWWED